MRSTKAGVVAAYDFSAPPANGGTWQWGSVSASPKVTVWGMNNTDPAVSANRAIDTAVFPSGSTASLRFDVPSGTGERADAWRISLDNYADQFGAGSEFWVQWRTRMNSTYATFPFKDRSGGLTGYKLMMVSAGMQYPYVVNGTTHAFYGYSSGASEIDNVILDARIDSIGEIVTRDRTAVANASHANNFKYVYPYISKYFDDTVTGGQDGNYYTYQNGGDEGRHVATCQFLQDSGGDQYSNAASCFQFPTDQWFTMMVHVKLGPYGTGPTSLGGATRTGYTNSTIETWGAYEGQTGFTLIHRRTGVVMPVDTTTPQGAQGLQKYGQFGFTTFMTQKDPAQSHATGKVWFGQIIVKSGPVPPAAPL